MKKGFIARLKHTIGGCKGDVLLRRKAEGTFSGLFGSCKANIVVEIARCDFCGKNFAHAITVDGIRYRISMEYTKIMLG